MENVNSVKIDNLCIICSIFGKHAWIWMLYLDTWFNILNHLDKVVKQSPLIYLSCWKKLHFLVCQKIIKIDLDLWRCDLFSKCYHKIEFCNDTCTQNALWLNWLKPTSFSHFGGSNHYPALTNMCLNNVLYMQIYLDYSLTIPPPY